MFIIITNLYIIYIIMFIIIINILFYNIMFIIIINILLFIIIIDVWYILYNYMNINNYYKHNNIK